MSGVPGSDVTNPEPDDHPARSTRPTRPDGPVGRRRWLRPTVAVVAAVVVVCLAAGSLYAFTLSRGVTANLHRAGGLLPGSAPASDPATQPPDSTKASGALDVVLMGSDSRVASDPGAGRSDVLMVAHLDADRKKAYLISFPRDMWVSIPGHDKAKINAAYAWGGAPLTVRTLENLLGTKMDHVAMIDFDGFVKLTDQLGGVTVDNKYPSKSHGFTYPVGKITLQGEQALWYVRERYQLPHGDLDRAQRQRIVVQAILAKGLSGDTVTNPVKFSSFVSQLAKSVTVDDSLSNAELRTTALSLRLSGGDIELLQAPISGFATIGGQDVDVVDEARLAELAAALRTDDLASYTR